MRIYNPIHVQFSCKIMFFMIKRKEYQTKHSCHGVPLPSPQGLHLVRYFTDLCRLIHPCNILSFCSPKRGRGRESLRLNSWTLFWNKCCHRNQISSADAVVFPRGGKASTGHSHLREMVMCLVQMSARDSCQIDQLLGSYLNKASR